MGPLSHSPAHIMSQVFVSKGWGTAPPTTTTQSVTWPVYADGQPDKPDNVITIFNTANRQHGRSQIDGEVQEHEGIMIQVRSASKPVGYAKANAVMLAMDKDLYDYAVTVEGVAYLVNCATRTSGIHSLGKESPDSSRYLYTINYVLALLKRS